MRFSSYEQQKAAFANMSSNVKSNENKLGLDDIIFESKESIMKYRWKVQPKPTGRYGSFEYRGWPDAEYENGKVAASMMSKSDYDSRDVKIGKHEPIILRIADYSVIPWKWRKIIGEFKTVQDAKDAFKRVLKQHPEIIPKDV